MQVVQVGDQVERVIQVSLLLLPLLPQQVGELHVPLQIDELLLFPEVAGCHELGKNRFGAELQRPQQVFDLPEVEDVFGDVFASFGLGDIHDGGVYLVRLSQSVVWPLWSRK